MNRFREGSRSMLAGISLLTLMLLASCGGGSSSSSGGGGGGTTPPPEPPAVTAQFDPASQVLPFPDDLLFSGSTDLTLNMPVDDPSDSSDPKVALNALDGFSTVAPWRTGFSAAIDADSLKAGEAIHVYEVTLEGPAGKVTGITRELASPDEYVVRLAPSDTDGKTLEIVPTRALKPRTSYMAVLTDGISDGNGKAVTASLTYTLAKGANPLCVDGASTNASLTDAEACALEPVRQRVDAQEAAAAGAGVTRADIVLSWVATTQSTHAVLQALSDTIEAGPPAATHFAYVSTVEGFGFGCPCRAESIYTGYIELPYYLGVPTAQDPTAPLTGFWHAAPGAYVPPADSFDLDPASTQVTGWNPLPVVNTTVGAPLLAVLPDYTGQNGQHYTKPAHGWPVVIYVHGLGGNRTEMLKLEQDYASHYGYAMLSMDLPLHGVMPDNAYFIENTPFAAEASERTFEMDFVNHMGAGPPGGDGFPDYSGEHFFNLSNLLTTRDNLRQGVADLVELEHAIGSMDIDDEPGPDLDPDRIYVLGHSLGAMIATDFMAVDSRVQTAVLNVPGGGIARMLDASPAEGYKLHEVLGEAGIEQGTPAYDRFMIAAQTVFDSGDPINFAAFTGGKNLLLQEVVGSDSSPPDQVFPNSVEGAPLSGTEPLIAALDLSAIDSTTHSDQGLRVATRFVKGAHGSLLGRQSPPESDQPYAFFEMRPEAFSFVDSGGQTMKVLFPEVLKPVDP